jgi:nucleoside-diphosphate-sugar epimerase
VILRPGIVIGRGGDPRHWGVGMWPWDSVCQVWGDGRNGLPIVLVDDVARALILALDAPGIEGESFNLVGPQSLTARDYLAELERHAGVSIQTFFTPPWKFFAGDVVKYAVKVAVRHPDRRLVGYRDWESRTQRARFDCTKACEQLGWAPAEDRDEVIRRGIHIPANEFLR